MRCLPLHLPVYESSGHGRAQRQESKALLEIDVQFADVGVQVGRLWTSLADYFIRQGMFERARDIYEEGLTTVITVRDFSLIFDALTTFETSLLEARMQVTLGSCLHTASLSMLQTKPSRSGAC